MEELLGSFGCVPIEEIVEKTVLYAGYTPRELFSPAPPITPTSLPFAWGPLTLQSVLAERNHAVYTTTVAGVPGTFVCKVCNASVELDTMQRMGAVFNRNRRGKTYIASGLLEAIVWRRANPDIFLTALAVACPEPTVVLLSRPLRNNLHHLVWRSTQAENTSTLSGMVMAALAQVLLVTLPNAHRAGLVHNDLKADNIMYEETTQEHIYVKNIVTGGCQKIPTNGRLFKLIDFEFASLDDVVSCASALNIRPQFRFNPSNPLTDVYILGECLARQLERFRSLSVYDGNWHHVASLVGRMAGPFLVPGSPSAAGRSAPGGSAERDSAYILASHTVHWPYLDPWELLLPHFAHINNPTDLPREYTIYEGVHGRTTQPEGASTV